MTKPNLSRGRASASISLRLSVEETQELRMAAKGQTLSAYIRAHLFSSEGEPNYEMRLSAFERQKLLAQILAEMGKSDLSTSLKELSQAAKMGVLPLTPDVLSEIKSAIADVGKTRKNLLKALGLKPPGGRA